MSGGTWTGLDVFRNAQTDADTQNPLKDTPLYLYGVARGTGNGVYWSGSVDLAVTKTVTGNFGDTTEEFRFKVSGLTSGDSYEYTRFTSTDGSSWTPAAGAGATGTLPADSSGEITFMLSHHQKIVISIPSGTNVTVSEANGLYTASYVIGSAGSEDGSSTGTITLEDDKTVAFTNNLDAPSPTGISFRILPFLFMLAAGLFLLPLLFRRKRKEEEEA